MPNTRVDTVIDKQHTKITLSLVILFVAWVAGGSWFLSNAYNRLESVERQVSKQWERMNETDDKLDSVTTNQAVIMNRIETVIELVKDRN